MCVYVYTYLIIFLFTKFLSKKINEFLGNLLIEIKIRNENKNRKLIHLCCLVYIKIFEWIARQWWSNSVYMYTCIGQCGLEFVLANIRK